MQDRAPRRRVLHFAVTGALLSGAVGGAAGCRVSTKSGPAEAGGNAEPADPSDAESPDQPPIAVNPGPNEAGGDAGPPPDETPLAVNPGPNEAGGDAGPPPDDRPIEVNPGPNKTGGDAGPPPS